MTQRHEALHLVARVLDYLFGLLYTVLLVRLVLELMMARRTSGFVELIASVTNPFYAPFKGIVASDTLDGTHPIVWPLVIAIVAYMILHGAIRGLMHLAVRD
jgi:uncharacterized protein YggT (Ycf19 family)